MDFELLEGVRNVSKEHMINCPFTTPITQRTFSQLFQWYWPWQGM